MGWFSDFVGYFDLNERAKEAKLDEEDQFEGHPYLIIISGLDSEFTYFADYREIKFGPEHQVEGIFWRLKGAPDQEWYGSGILIMYNPNFDWKQPDIKYECPVEVV